ncbi:PKD family protein [Chitinophaga polysaccharea]|uniref:PKD family protein n=2 Tax=Chitinophaga polysaccharea TaxID=1293035 RepID=A0A561P421_9BACT|nr:PKD family protein [Chitinophaga polysaccharea]
MNNRLIVLLSISVCCFMACKKDLGNYRYHSPAEPVISGLIDSTVNAIVGDSLIIRPGVSLADGDPAKDLFFDWDILVAEEARADHYTGYPLRIVYNLKPMVREAKLTVTDQRNGIKYFYKFKIDGGTRFSKGAAVLSVDNGVTRLSFIRPDSSVNADLYHALHNEDLPVNPVQLFAKPLAYQENTVEDYWVICKDPAKQSVIIDGSTMLRKRYFGEQFFNPPTPMETQAFNGAQGVPTGIVNGKLYLSITSTAPFAPDFGKFSSMQTGNYYLAPFYSRYNFFFGFDTIRHGFVTFDGGGNFMGSDYQVVGTAFNPANIGAGELLFMQAIPSVSYAYYKSADGNVYEYTFTVDMSNYDLRTIKPTRKRIFKGAALLTNNSRWQRSAVDIFYFTANDRIYRYNPVNEDLRPLDANFGGKKVTMLKLSTDGNTLTAGVDGSVLLLDVSVGKNGVVTGRVDGIPGEPVDIVSRK